MHTDDTLQWWDRHIFKSACLRTNFSCHIGGSAGLVNIQASASGSGLMF